MEQEMPDYETIRAAVTGEKWALEKVLDCYGDEINHLAMVKKRQPDGTTKEEIDEDLRQTLILKLLEACLLYTSLMSGIDIEQPKAIKAT